MCLCNMPKSIRVMLCLYAIMTHNSFTHACTHMRTPLHSHTRARTHTHTPTGEAGFIKVMNFMTSVMNLV